MIKLDLVCGACKHSFQLEATSILKDQEKQCPECGSGRTRQTLTSYLRNGPLLDPQWSRVSGRSGFG